MQLCIRSAICLQVALRLETILRAEFGTLLVSSDTDNGPVPSLL